MAFFIQRTNWNWVISMFFGKPKKTMKRKESASIQLPLHKFSKFERDRKREVKKVQKSRFVEFSEDAFFAELYKDNVPPQACVNLGGGGKFSYFDWINVDSQKPIKPKKNYIQFDFLNESILPIESNSVDVIYCSHVLEHLTESASDYLLFEMKRIAKPAAYVRLVVPDFDLALRAFLQGDIRFFEEFFEKHRAKDEAKKHKSENCIEFCFLRFFVTQKIHHWHPNNYLNRFDELRGKNKEEIFILADRIISEVDIEHQKLHPNCHINYFNFEKLFSKLDKIGFTDIKRSGYGQSDLNKLRDTRYFDCTRPRQSLFVEARVR